MILARVVRKRRMRCSCKEDRRKHGQRVVLGSSASAVFAIGSEAPRREDAGLVTVTVERESGVGGATLIRSSKVRMRRAKESRHRTQMQMLATVIATGLTKEKYMWYTPYLAPKGRMTRQAFPTFRRHSMLSRKAISKRDMGVFMVDCKGPATLRRSVATRK
eukprot:scaffold3656_cov254-Pinguiococcus_pyrenoidosus.AAC.11